MLRQVRRWPPGSSARLRSRFAHWTLVGRPRSYYYASPLPVCSPDLVSPCTSLGKGSGISRSQALSWPVPTEYQGGLARHARRREDRAGLRGLRLLREGVKLRKPVHAMSVRGVVAARYSWSRSSFHSVHVKGVPQIRE